MLARGGYIGYFSQGTPKKLTVDWAAIRPTLIAGVPKVFDEMIKTSAKTKKKWIVKGWKSWVLGKLPLCVAMPVARKVIGWNECKLVVSGSAPLLPSTGAWLRKVLGSRPLVEGFAMTETAALGFASTPGDDNLGHCGVPFDMVEVRLQSEPEFSCHAEDYILVDGEKVDCPRGEIQILGPANMTGYFKNDQATAETLTSDGWLMTGDLGRINPNGTISIIGRKKNRFKLANGEYIAPAKLEGIYGKAEAVKQIWFYGNSFKNVVVAVVTPDSQWAKALLKAADRWPKGEDADPASAEFRAKFHKVCSDKDNNQFLTEQMWKVLHGDGETLPDKNVDTSTLKRHEKLPSKDASKQPCAETKRFPIILETDIDELGNGFNVANKCLTPTFKLRRKNLKERNMDKLKATYTDLGYAPKDGEKWW